LVGADVYCIRDYAIVRQRFNLRLLGAPILQYVAKWELNHVWILCVQGCFLQKGFDVGILKDEAMPNQARVAKVLATLLASMTTGAIVLMALGHNPPSAGPFSLSAFCRLDPVKKAISSQAAQSPGRWDSLGGHDGQIQATEKWQKQWPAISSRTRYVSGQTIRICITADGKSIYPTDCQIKRIQVLVEGLCKKFRIRPESIYYPSDWR
jgi:hypothetical protein